MCSGKVLKSEIRKTLSHAKPQTGETQNPKQQPLQLILKVMLVFEIFSPLLQILLHEGQGDKAGQAAGLTYPQCVAEHPMVCPCGCASLLSWCFSRLGLVGSKRQPMSQTTAGSSLLSWPCSCKLVFPELLQLSFWSTSPCRYSPTDVPLTPQSLTSLIISNVLLSKYQLRGLSGPAAKSCLAMAGSCVTGSATSQHP